MTAANDLASLDPALASMQRLRELCPQTSAAVGRMRAEAIFSDRALPARHKVLAALLWSMAMRCEPCVKFYAREARRRGASLEELAVFLDVAATMGGCVGETWAVKALHAFERADDAAQADACCQAPPDKAAGA